MLRRLNFDENRTVVLRNVNSGEEAQLSYQPPVGEKVATASRQLAVDDFQFTLSAEIYLAPEDLDQQPTDRREGGLLVLDEYNSALDLSLFRFDSDPDAAKIFGEVQIGGLRQALLADENIVTEERDGLNRTNPIAQALISEIESMLQPIVKMEREKSAKTARKLSSTTRKRVDNMLHELNKLAAEYTGIGQNTGTKKKIVSGSGKSTTEKVIPSPDLMEFVPKSLTLVPGVPESVSLYVNTKRCVGEAIVYSELEDLDVMPESFSILAQEDIYHQSISLRCDVAGAQGTVVVETDAGALSLPFRVNEISYPLPAEGIEFIPATKDVTAGRIRTLDLYIDITRVAPYSMVIFEVEDGVVADLKTTSARVEPATARDNVVHIPVKLVGRKVGAKTNVLATCGSLSSRCSIEVRSRKAKERNSGGLFAGISFEGKVFPKCWFRPDDENMVINTREPSFDLLNVSEATFESDRGVQVAVAEAITQVACARIAEKTVPGGGKRPWYLSNDMVKRMQEDRVFTEQMTRFVGPVVYRNLVQAVARATPAVTNGEGAPNLRLVRAKKGVTG
jgi:hypothetical protein